MSDMARTKRSAVQKYYDRVAPRYDASYDDAFWQWHDALTWDYLKPFLPTDMRTRVLDLGCGTGKWAAKLLKSGYSVTCVDVSHSMLDRARKKIEQQGGVKRASFVQADLCEMGELPAAQAGLAVAFGDPIGCTRSPARTMKQIRRLLTPGGVLVATFDNRLAAIDYYLGQGEPTVLARFLRDGKTHWLTKDAAEQFEITTYAPGDVRNLVQAAGFEVLDVVGKTVLPMRHYRELLAEAGDRRRWAKIEKSVCREPAAIGRASHVQIACRVADRAS